MTDPEHSRLSWKTLFEAPSARRFPYENWPRRQLSVVVSPVPIPAPYESPKDVNPVLMGFLLGGRTGEFGCASVLLVSSGKGVAAAMNVPKLLKVPATAPWSCPFAGTLAVVMSST
jgi:hypothetical protein